MGGCGSSTASNAFVGDRASYTEPPASQLPPAPVLLGKTEHRSPPVLQHLKRPAPPAEPETLYAEDPVRIESLGAAEDQEDEEEEEEEEEDTLASLPGADHIGWVAKRRDVDPRAVDRSGDFLSVLQDVKTGTHELRRRWDLAYLIVPGFFHHKYPTYMKVTRNHLRSLGLDCHIADVDTRKSLKENAESIASLVEELSVLTGKRVVLVGHSRGGCDAVATVSRHGARLRKRVAGVLCLQAPLGGSPLAGDFVGKHLSGRVLRTVRYVLGGEVDALGEVTYERRREELDAFPYPYGSAPLLTFSSETRRKDSLLGPLASHMHRRYQGLPNDGLAASADAHLPFSTRVAWDADWDHGACAFPAASTAQGEELVNEALLALLVQEVPTTAPNSDTSLVPIYDYWHHVRREHTFHHGNPWAGERKSRVAFYAFRRQVEGTEPVHSFWNSEYSVHTFHLDEPAEGETRKGIQFYAFRNAVDGAEPVFSFWHEENTDYTIHMGEAASGEVKRGVLFYAFRHPRPMRVTAPSICRVNRV